MHRDSDAKAVERELGAGANGTPTNLNGSSDIVKP
jgi:hypothetical protein